MIVRPELYSVVHFYELDGHAVLFHEQRRKLYVLNSTASYLWQRIDSGASTTEVADEISLYASVPVEQAGADIAELLAQWKHEGLVEDGRAERSVAMRPPDRGRSRTTRMARRRTAGFRQTATLLDCAFHLSSDADLAELVNLVAGHRSGTDSRNGAAVEIEIYRSRAARRWLLAADGIVIAKAAAREEIAPMLHANLYMLAYRESDCFVGIHAAAVSTDSRCILMPGLSGSGKSTLTAALVSDGFSYCTDDLAIIGKESLRLRPMPLCIGLKPGAWDALRSRFPEIDALPVHRRADGRFVKYLLPHEPLFASTDKEHSVTDVIFPRYAVGSECRLESISHLDALLRLTEAGYDLRGDLTPSWVTAMLEWLRSLRCYELTFDKLDDAVAAVSRVALK